jgi:oligopeptide transport system substrate-binding protein
MCSMLVGCTGGGAPPPKVGLSAAQTLTFPIAGEFNSLDPATLDTPADSQIAHNLYDGLVRLDDDMQVAPDIAVSLPVVSSDGLTYTFTLRTDVTFSNGDKVTSKDVLYSWNRAAAMQGPYSVNLSAIAGYDVVSRNRASGPALEALLEKKDPSVTMSGLTAPDGHTVVVQLATPAGWFLPAIAQPSVTGMIVDENVVKTDFDNWWTKPETLVGTGAFRMTAHSPNQSYDFAAVSRWWGSPRPTLSNVHLEIAPDPTSAIGTYEQGGYDVVGFGAYGVLVRDVLRIQSTPSEKGQLLLQPKNATYWVSFNLVADAKRAAAGPFTIDQGKTAHDLRLAFAIAVDRTRLAKEVCQNIVCAPATGGLISMGLLGYLGDGADPLGAYDPGRAKALLASADPTGNKTRGLVYTYDPENPINEPLAKFLQTEWLDNLGVAVAVQAVPSSSFIDARLRGGYVLARDGWAADYNDPQNWFDNLWGMLAGCPDTSCSSGYESAPYDKLLAKADAEPLTASTDDYAMLSRQLAADVAYIPLYYSTGVFLFKPYLAGAGSNNLFDYYWDQIKVQAH